MNFVADYLPFTCIISLYLEKPYDPLNMGDTTVGGETGGEIHYNADGTVGTGDGEGMNTVDGTTGMPWQHDCADDGFVTCADGTCMEGEPCILNVWCFLFLTHTFLFDFNLDRRHIQRWSIARKT